jgi:hypothetical protein
MLQEAAMTQTRRRRFIWLSAGAGAFALVLTGTSAGPALAQTFKPMMALITNDASNPVPVRAVGSNLTHVGRPVSDFVRLEYAGASGATCFRRVAPDNTTDPDCYTPESGRAAIITDVHWSGPSIRDPGDLDFLLLSFNGSVVTFSAVVGGNRLVANDRHLQTGFVFPPGLRPIPIYLNVQLYGYVVANE